MMNAKVGRSGMQSRYSYQIDRKNDVVSIEILKDAISQAKMGSREKVEAIKRIG